MRCLCMAAGVAVMVIMDSDSDDRSYLAVSNSDIAYLIN
jgi:hypothetical protein